MPIEVARTLLAALLTQASGAAPNPLREMVTCSVGTSAAPHHRLVASTRIFPVRRGGEDYIVAGDVAYSFASSYQPLERPVATGGLVFGSVELFGDSSENWVRLRVNMRAPMGARLGRFRIRYEMAGRVIRERDAIRRVELPHRGNMATVNAADYLPLAALPRQQGRLDIVLLQSTSTVPILRFTFQLDGLGLTDWHRAQVGSEGLVPSERGTGRLLDSLPPSCSRVWGRR